MVVTVEVWPGGSPRGKVHVGTMTLVNESHQAEISDYDVWVDGERKGKVRHHRSDGAWPLVNRALALRPKVKAETIADIR